MISFSDAQIQSISSDMVAYPVNISVAQGNLATVIAAQAVFLQKDADNITFQNHFLNIVTQFHWELGNLNGLLRTNYNVSNIDPAARMTPGNAHYPSGWTFMYPKVIPSNNGLPTTAIANELAQINSFIARSAIMVGGFGSGTSNTTTTSAISGNTVSINPLASSGFPIGASVVIYNGSDLCAGEIIGSSFGQLTINFSVIPSSSFPAGATITNAFSGFSNSSRQSLPSTFEFNSIRGSMDLNSTLLKNTVSNQLDALHLNESGDASNATAISQANAILSIINNWRNGPSSGTSGRYCDAILNPFLSNLNVRVSQAKDRIAAIITLLGSVASSSTDGSYSGSGYYLQLLQWINARVSMMAGSLRGYYDSSLGINAIQSLIASAQQKQTSSSLQMSVSLLSKDADGTNKVFVESASTFLGFSTAKVIADNQTVLTVNITGISVTENSLTFGTIVGASYSVANNARVVVQK